MEWGRGRWSVALISAAVLGGTLGGVSGCATGGGASPDGGAARAPYGAVDATDRSGPALELRSDQGVSGMEVLSEASPLGARALVVHDSKDSPDEKDLPRLGVIGVRGQSVDYAVIPVDWTSTGPASDLEAVCLVPGTDDEILALESGYYEGRYGRLFHLRLETSDTGSAAGVVGRVLGSAQLPTVAEQIEGMACAPSAEMDEVLVVLGERGESESYDHGIFRWARLDLSALPDTLSLNSVDYAEATDFGARREISALHLDDGGRLWAAAAHDEGDGGPFWSLVYLVGEVDGGRAQPIRLLDEPMVVARVQHLKIEGLSGPIAPGSWFSAGTEDEDLGAYWFPIYAPLVELQHR